MHPTNSIKQQLEKYHTESFGWAMCCCQRNEVDAEETLQMTYLKILEGKARYAGRASFKTWLFAVIRNTAIDLQRKNQRRLKWLNGQKKISEPACPPSHELVMQREMEDIIKEAMSRLSGRQKELLQLVFYHDMSIEEAAEVTGISVGSARTHYTRGKQKLKCWLGKRREELL